MKTMASKLTKDHLEQIADFLVIKFPALKSGGRTRSAASVIDLDIRERIVRTEEELKTQRDLMREILGMMEKRFEQVDKRFEQVDKRFEQVDKRFEELREDMDKRFTMMMWFIGLGFTVITAFTVIMK
jgi:DNA anti-recombination protein RmuC